VTEKRERKTEKDNRNRERQRQSRETETETQRKIGKNRREIDAKEKTKEKEKRAEMILLAFISSYFILPGSGRACRLFCACGFRIAVQSLSIVAVIAVVPCACARETEPEAASAGCNSRWPIRKPSKINLLEINEAQIVHAL
jgi:hypothetical protein